VRTVAVMNLPGSDSVCGRRVFSKICMTRVDKRLVGYQYRNSIFFNPNYFMISDEFGLQGGDVFVVLFAV